MSDLKTALNDCYNSLNSVLLNDLKNHCLENFEEICENLLTKGYCRISDFKNFKLY